jgi:hypothetical protein
MFWLYPFSFSVFFITLLLLYVNPFFFFLLLLLVPPWGYYGYYAYRRDRRSQTYEAVTPQTNQRVRFDLSKNTVELI